MNRKATLGVAGQMAVLPGFVDADDTSRVRYISSDLAFNLNKALHADRLCFTSC